MCPEGTTGPGILLGREASRERVAPGETWARAREGLEGAVKGGVQVLMVYEGLAQLSGGLHPVGAFGQ